MSYNRMKYNNKKITVDGQKFDSKKEANRYKELLLLEKAGEIKDLRTQVKFKLIPAQRDEATGRYSMATRKLLDSLVGKEVCVNLPDEDEFVGILHKTGNETDPNLYLMKNYYYVADDIGNVIGCLFRASHVKKITNLDI